MEFVIERSKWIRGEVGAKLLKEDGRMCCLGFISNQCGVPTSQLLNKSYPESVRRFRNRIPFLLDEGDNSPLANVAMKINDNDIDEYSREAQLKRLFKKHDIKLRFVK